MKKSKVGLRKLIVFCIIWISSWSLYIYFRASVGENLLPFMDILFYFPIIVLMLHITISLCKDLITILKTKRKNKIKSLFVEIICSGIVLFILLWFCILSGKDIVEGPKETTLFNVKLVERRGSRRRKHYYIKGVTSDNKQIELSFKHYRQSTKDINELIKKNIYLKISYFENSKFAYSVEETEYELYKPNIDIIEVPSIDIQRVK